MHSCTSTHTHKCTHISFHSWVCEDCTEVSGSVVRLHRAAWLSGGSLLPPVCPLIFLFISVSFPSHSLFSLSISVSPAHLLLVRLRSARTRSWRTHCSYLPSLSHFMSISLQELIMWQTVQTRLTTVSDTVNGVESQAETHSDGCKRQMVDKEVKEGNPTWNMLPAHLYLFNIVYSPLLTGNNLYDVHVWYSSGVKMRTRSCKYFVCLIIITDMRS